MSKIKIILDSASGIDILEKEHEFDVIPLDVYLDEKKYFEDGTFYEKLEHSKTFKTSQPSTGMFLDVFNNAKRDGYTDLIYITIASGLSGTYQGGMVAKRMIDGINIHLFDSKFIGFLQARLAIIAKKMADNGKNVQEIINRLTEIRESHNVYIAIDTLKYLVKNGRLSVASGFVGSLIKLKPLLMANNENGKIIVKEKVRTKKKSIDRMIELFYEETKNLDVVTYLLYTNNLNEVEEVKKRLIVLDKKYEKTIISGLPPVIGLHAGGGTFGMGYFKL